MVGQATGSLAPKQGRSLARDRWATRNPIRFSFIARPRSFGPSHNQRQLGCRGALIHLYRYRVRRISLLGHIRHPINCDHGPQLRLRHQRRGRQWQRDT